MKTTFFAVLLMAMTSINSFGCDCGWVLWRHETSEGIDGSTDKWSIFEAHERKAQCDADRYELAKKVIEGARIEMETGKLIKYSSGSDFVTKVVKTDSLPIYKMERFYCLPGTLDPRRASKRDGVD